MDCRNACLAIFQPTHPDAFFCGTPKKCRGTLVIALGIILVLTPLIVGVLRRTHVKGLSFISQGGANFSIALSATALPLALVYIWASTNPAHFLSTITRLPKNTFTDMYSRTDPFQAAFHNRGEG